MSIKIKKSVEEINDEWNALTKIEQENLLTKIKKSLTNEEIAVLNSLGYDKERDLAIIQFVYDACEKDYQDKVGHIKDKLMSSIIINRQCICCRKLKGTISKVLGGN